MSKVTTIAQHWARYMREVMPPNANGVQIQETRRAFYAAAYAVLVSMRDELALLEDDEAVRVLEALHAECHAFAQRVGGGKA
jgi:hypothetical protein